MFFVSIMWVMNGLLAMDINDQLNNFNQERIKHQEPLKKAKDEIAKLKEQNEILENKLVESDATKKIYALHINKINPNYFENQEEEKKEIERITNLESTMEATQKALDNQKECNNASEKWILNRNKKIEYYLDCLKTKNKQLVYSAIGNLLLTGLVIYLYRRQVIS